ncbi:MAG: DUF3592 domain-containing protein [Betaproteobacteria bacterium]|nr:DUF3592 domain-containing protein [Betaproteobacteria bacterium]
MGKVGGIFVCLVFGLPFGGVGVWATHSIVETLSAARSARDWVKVRATVDNAKLESGDGTYRAEAAYRYRFEGKDYTGTRLGISTLGGSDNIDDWHEQIAGRLEDARSAGIPITVWVNPDNPAEAVVDREIRWKELLFLAPFSLAFGGVGVGALVAMFFVIRGSAPAGWGNDTREPVRTRPGALASPGAKSPEISTAGQSGLGFLWVFAFFWNAISFPIAILAIPEMVQSGEWLGLFVLLFPLVGLLLLWTCVSTTFKAIRSRINLKSAPAVRGRAS